jgi:hypothetical protein
MSNLAERRDRAFHGDFGVGLSEGDRLDSNSLLSLTCAITDTLCHNKHNVPNLKRTASMSQLNIAAVESFKPKEILESYPNSSFILIEILLLRVDNSIFFVKTAAKSTPTLR